MDDKVKDIKQIKRQKHLSAFFKRMLAFIIIASIGIMLYITSDQWYPKLEGIGNKYIIENTEDFASVEFPIKISDGAKYSVSVLGNNISLVNDTHFNIYSSRGALTSSRQHNFSSPILKASGNKALLYDLGGKTFKVESKNKTIYEKELEDSIIFARISSEGYVAVVSDSDKYVCLLTVYDRNGNVVYTRGSIERIADVVFTDHSSACIVVNTDAETGELNSTAVKVQLNKKDELWIASNIDTFCVATFVNNSDFLIVGDDKYSVYGENGNMKYLVNYPNQLKDYSFTDNMYSFLFENTKQRESSIYLHEVASETPITINLKDEIKSISANGTYVFALGYNKLYKYNYAGELVGEVDVDTDFHTIKSTKGYILLLGYDRIEKMDIEISVEQYNVD